MLSSEDFTFYDIRDQRPLQNMARRAEMPVYTLGERRRKQNLWLPNQNSIDMPDKLNALF